MLPLTPLPSEQEQDEWRWAMVGIAFPVRRKYTLLLDVHWLLKVGVRDAIEGDVPLGMESPRDRGSHALFTVKAEPQNEALHVTVKEQGQVVLPQRTVRPTRLWVAIDVQGVRPV